MPTALATPPAGSLPAAQDSVEPPCLPLLNDSEAAILATLGSQLMSSKEIARQAGLRRNRHFAAALGNLYRLGLLVKTSNDRWARAAVLAAENREPPGPSLADELRAVRRQLRSIRRLLRRLARPARLASPAPPQLPTAPAQDSRPVEGAAATSAATAPTGCRADIVRVLREAGGRLTLPALLAQLRQRGLNWDQQTVQSELARLVETGRAHERPAPQANTLSPVPPSQETVPTAG